MLPLEEAVRVEPMAVAEVAVPAAPVEMGAFTSAPLVQSLGAAEREQMEGWLWTRRLGTGCFVEGVVAAVPRVVPASRPPVAVAVERVWISMRWVTRLNSLTALLSRSDSRVPSRAPRLGTWSAESAVHPLLNAQSPAAPRYMVPAI
jgi:hypothetical protein